MKFETQVNIHNRFDIVKNGEFVGSAENIILDAMYARLVATTHDFFYTIHFGTGSGTPTPERTSLFTYLGAKPAVTVESVRAYPTSRWVRKITLNPEEFVGATLTEVGVGYGTGSTTLLTHAMIKDAEGNPLSITKTSLDVIEIYATIFSTFNSSQRIMFTEPVSKNGLVTYLTSATATGLQEPMVNVGISKDESSKWGPHMPCQYLSAATRTNSVANRNIKFTKRFGITEANTDIHEVALRNLVRVILSPDCGFSAFNVANKIVGTGDGVNTVFSLPDGNIVDGSLILYKNGVEIPSNQYTFTNTYGENDQISLKDLIISSTGDKDNEYATEVPKDTQLFYDNLEPNSYVRWDNYNKITFHHAYPRKIKGFMIYSAVPETSSSYQLSLTNLRGSTDGVNWSENLIPSSTLVGPGYGNLPISLIVLFPPAEYPFIQFAVATSGSFKKDSRFTFVRLIAGPPENIVFNSPVEQDAVITASYALDYAPKNSDYVFDVEVTVQFGEGV